MARFEFRLATLVKLREAARDERRRQLGEAYQAEATLQARIDENHQELHGLRDVYGAASQPGAVAIDRLVEAQRYELLLRAQLGVYQEQSKLLAEEIERRRLALLEADRDVRVLEKLREKQLARHLELAAKQEMKVIDEIAGRTKWEGRRP